MKNPLPASVIPYTINSSGVYAKFSHLIKLVVFLIFSQVFLGDGTAAERPRSVTAKEYDEMMKSISNWNRWGKEDQLGTINLITPGKRIEAARLVQKGISVSLALELNTKISDMNNSPFKHKRISWSWEGHQGANDQYSVSYHGWAHSHMDGLLHFSYQGKFCNGFEFSDLDKSIKNGDGSFTKLGIHNYQTGILTRGILVDMPLLLGKDYMEPGIAVMPSDIEQWEKKTGLKIGSGDVLLIRTGRWERIRKKGGWNFIVMAAGANVDLAPWLKERDVAMIGSDGVNDVSPSNVQGLPNPLHALVIVGLGMPALDNLDLDKLAETAKKLNRWDFMFTCSPMRVVGGTGSPLNPQAFF